MLDKTFTPASVEDRQYKRWQDSGVFSCGRHPTAQPYTIMMPPPNVTGSLHIGHALTFTLQDILARYHRLRGYDVLWQPGTDHAGIATQMVVERRLAAQGISRHDLGRTDFIKQVWAWKKQSGDTITDQLRRLGASADWSRQRFTLDEGMSQAVRKVFVALYEQGLIYRDKRLVNWDPELKTAISDLEVDPREVQGKMWRFRYPLADNPDQGITIATTRPETMLGDVAVAVHPQDDRYQHLVGRRVRLPIVERAIPIIADSYADPHKGSGAVKITPAHDVNDFAVGRRHDLPCINIFDASARINDAAPAAYRGLDRFEAREKIIAEMTSLGLFEGCEATPMIIPHGDRSGVIIEPWLTDQWYVDAPTLAGPALQAVEEGRIRFTPKNWENTYFEWLRNIQPWCISRQLWWGHRIPAWYGPDGHAFIALTQEDAQAQAQAHYADRVELKQDPDVLDTWFSSALWPFSTLGWPTDTPDMKRYYPGHVLVTGFDIIFFWVARMIMMGLHFVGDVPFRHVYIHALVRDEQGQKMSKSKGNVIDPLKMIDSYGCDAVRFTLAALAGPGRDINLGESVLAGYRNFATKLWNAARFCAMNGCFDIDHSTGHGAKRDASPGFDPAGCRLILNRWIIGETARLARDVADAFDSYRFDTAAGAVYRFVWGVFCDWYLEFLKPVFAHGTAEDKAESRNTAAWSLANILHIIHPIMPYVSEALYERLFASDLLLTSTWPSLPATLINEDAANDMNWVIDCVSTIRAGRTQTGIPPAQPLAVTVQGANPTTCARLKAHGPTLIALARLQYITPVVGDSAPKDKEDKNALRLSCNEATLIIPLAGILNVEAERDRLNREIGRQNTQIERLDKKLNNRQFLQKAPPDVVAEQQKKRTQAAATLAGLQAALDQLSS